MLQQQKNLVDILPNSLLHKKSKPKKIQWSQITQKICYHELTSGDLQDGVK